MIKRRNECFNICGHCFAIGSRHDIRTPKILNAPKQSAHPPRLRPSSGDSTAGASPEHHEGGVRDLITNRDNILKIQYQRHADVAHIQLGRMDTPRAVFLSTSFSSLSHKQGLRFLVRLNSVFYFLCGLRHKGHQMFSNAIKVSNHFYNVLLRFFSYRHIC